MKKKILIIEEASFSHICSAILRLEGYHVDVLNYTSNFLSKIDNREYGLIITSYPYMAVMLDKIRAFNIPTIILSNHLNRDLIDILNDFNNTYCMVKPLDYRKFRMIIREMLSENRMLRGQINII